MTATIIPLELMFEHRNYFASLGVCIALGDALLRWTQPGTPRRLGAMGAIALLLLYGGMTVLRANEWRSPQLFASTEAAKHPQSPRATYALARELVILTGFHSDSPYLPLARQALSRAMEAPGSTPLPEAAAILLEARLQQPVPERLWIRLQQKLATHPIGPQETNALAALVDCQLAGRCDLPQDAMVRTFQAAVMRGPNAEVFNIFGNYALNALRDPNAALSTWLEAARLAPNVPQYQATVARMLIASGRPREAERYIRRIRALGAIGQNETLARELEDLARQTGQSQPRSPGHRLDSPP
jgi:hypothetical protein